MEAMWIRISEREAMLRSFMGDTLHVIRSPRISDMEAMHISRISDMEAMHRRPRFVNDDQKIELAGETLMYQTLNTDLQLKQNTCPICCDDFKNDTKIFVTCCLHIFNCISTWIEENKTCPICRSKM